MDKTLTPLAASDPLRRSIAEPDEVSLFEWIVDAFIVTISDGAMGKTNIYAIFTRRPRILAPKAYAACDKLAQILAKYFALPREAKIGCAEFVTMAEDEIRSAAVSEEELAKMFVWIYWG
ncbi:hypothetical protein AtubIFM55763_004319 [Aspergillus tubingensis]|uniref:Uncharacterized protein n=1 Tax=Aspergillus tubingensis TaxID=5068 RepID=A0A9W6EIY4_ASPTU|nr:hypothetical protein AtubIFM54640_005766 [Aspergillus tubingensis]GLA73404.1 hypothetical protein AtubIFM55763_004319 [Aspergillus tubingensis]GLA81119.1 hypothetical protein AtubIFM56815_004755 [Aspergillus tubingensis]GLA91647.1 hypothetical protein AtubIFM57143_005153 [Aspergillus tubingensis]GLB17772.1 hypothetical protein AtubIFM61612_007658 [Aspergillus tubingensis]